MAVSLCAEQPRTVVDLFCSHCRPPTKLGEIVGDEVVIIMRSKHHSGSRIVRADAVRSITCERCGREWTPERGGRVVRRRDAG